MFNMKVFLNSFVFLLIYTSVNAAVFDTGSYTLSSFEDEENIINSGAIINSDSSGIIYVNHTAMTIENYGIVNGDLNTNGHNVHIRNSGVFNGQILVDADDKITQIIQSDADITQLPISDEYSYIVSVEGFRDYADLMKLKALTAGSFIITDSNIIMDDFSQWQNWDKDITLVGANTLYITNSYTVDSGAYIKFVNNASTINVVLLDADRLHKTNIVSGPYGSYARLFIVRETDYTKVFDDNRGVLLEQVRAKNPNDKFLMQLDAAENMPQVQNIMNSSYHFNQSILMRPVNVFNKFSLIDVLYDTQRGDVDFSPFYVMSNNVDGFGIRLGISGKYDDVYIDSELNFGKFDYQNEFNDFSGFMYGANVKLKKTIKDFWVDGVLGLSLIDFDADNIYVDDKIENNPLGLSLYSAADFGYDYKLLSDLTFSLFGGVVAQHQRVDGFSDFDVNLRGGGKLKYSFDIDGIKYEYLFVGGIDTDQDLFAMFKLGFVSYGDGGGVYIGTDLVNNEYGVNYKFSVDAKFMF